MLSLIFLCSFIFFDPFGKNLLCLKSCFWILETYTYQFLRPFSDAFYVALSKKTPEQICLFLCSFFTKKKTTLYPIEDNPFLIIIFKKFFTCKKIFHSFLKSSGSWYATKWLISNLIETSILFLILRKRYHYVLYITLWFEDSRKTIIFYIIHGCFLPWIHDQIYSMIS